MKRRILSFIICLAMIISLLPQTVLFAQAATSGTCGDNLTWKLYDNERLVISGTGAMTNWRFSIAPWHSSRSSIKSIAIENGVTSIGDEAFYGCSNLESVYIPDSVTSIGYEAFYGCRGLTSVSIPSSVTSIGERAFNCSSLESIYVKKSNPNYCDIDGVLYSKDNTEIIQYPRGKTETSYVIQNGVTNIGNDAFYECRNLTSITIPNGVTSIGDYAFYDCSRLTSIAIPNGVTSIGDYAFYYCSSLTSITIPNGVTSIGDYTFFYCRSLTSITIPNGVTRIGELAFYNCSSLTSITIPNGVTRIGERAFQDCTNLERITIPESVTSISDSAFSHCYSLTSVTIPNSVTSIGDWAFYGCDNLSTVYYGGDEEGWKKISIGTENECLTGAEIIYQKSEVPDKYKINSITVRNIYGATLNAVPTGICLASMSITNQTYTGDAIVMLASYTADGQYVGLMQAPIEDLQVDGTIEVTLPIDNSKGTIAQLKAFVVSSFSNPTPLGAAVTFPAQ